MTDAFATAAHFVHRFYPEAVAAFLGGSAAQGLMTPTSDLDILVIVNEEPGGVAYVETSRHEGWLIEAFVYSPSGADLWMQRDRDQRRPVLDSIVAHGVPLTDNDTTAEWATRSREIIAAGPRHPDSIEIDSKRYALSAFVDDLEGCTDRAEQLVIAASAFTEAAELTLLMQRQWLGNGKWLIKNLRAVQDDGLVTWAGGNRDVEDLSTICRSVLINAGGYLQEGFLRGTRAQR